MDFRVFAQNKLQRGVSLSETDKNDISLVTFILRNSLLELDAQTMAKSFNLKF